MELSRIEIEIGAAIPAVAKDSNASAFLQMKSLTAEELKSTLIRVTFFGIKKSN